MAEKKYIVAVCGATGAVGREMLRILHERSFPAEDVLALASARSAGKTVSFGEEQLIVEEMTPESFYGAEIALFSAGGGPAKEFAPAAVEAGCVVVDNSSAWRMDPKCPLVVPEVNAADLKWHKGIIPNPNCSTIQMVMALKPLHDAAVVKRVVVSTYQAVSGTGQGAIDELSKQVKQLFSMQDPEVQVYPHQIAFNCLPHIDAFEDNDYTREEMKMVNETKKILGSDSIAVTATAVRVPVFYGHSESVNIETEKKLEPEEARMLLAQFPGVTVIDKPDNLLYPMPLDAAGENDTFVGRIREDETIANGLNMWIVADNIRKGAALNTIQIAEKLIEMDLVRVPE